MTRPSMYQLFRKYAINEPGVVDVKTFLRRYYKPDRYTGRGDEYAAGLLSSYEKSFDEDGFVAISHHDNVTGEVVAFYKTED